MKCPHCDALIHECDPRDLEDAAFRRTSDAIRKVKRPKVNPVDRPQPQPMSFGSVGGLGFSATPAIIPPTKPNPDRPH